MKQEIETRASEHFLVRKVWAVSGRQLLASIQLGDIDDYGYLHPDGAILGSLVSDKGNTGYFDTIEELEAAYDKWLAKRGPPMSDAKPTSTLNRQARVQGDGSDWHDMGNVTYEEAARRLGCSCMSLLLAESGSLMIETRDVDFPDVISLHRVERRQTVTVHTYRGD